MLYVDHITWQKLTEYVFNMQRTEKDLDGHEKM